MAKVGRSRETVKRVAGRPYREPTQVPLGEQPKACRGTPAEGNRQMGAGLSPLFHHLSFILHYEHHYEHMHG